MHAWENGAEQTEPCLFSIGNAGPNIALTCRLYVHVCTKTDGYMQVIENNWQNYSEVLN
jgi:hypothetical protein